LEHYFGRWGLFLDARFVFGLIDIDNTADSYTTRAIHFLAGTKFRF